MLEHLIVLDIILLYFHITYFIILKNNIIIKYHIQSNLMVVISHHTSSLLLERIKKIHSIQLSLYDNHYYYISGKIDVINKPNDITLVYYHIQ